MACAILLTFIFFLFYNELQFSFQVLQWSCKKSQADASEISLFFASGNSDLATIATEDCGISFVDGVKTQTVS